MPSNNNYYQYDQGIRDSDYYYDKQGVRQPKWLESKEEKKARERKEAAIRQAIEHEKADIRKAEELKAAAIRRAKELKRLPKKSCYKVSVEVSSWAGGARVIYERSDEYPSDSSSDYSDSSDSSSYIVNQE